MKKIVSLMLVFAMICSLSTIVSAATDSLDITVNWIDSEIWDSDGDEEILETVAAGDDVTALFSLKKNNYLMSTTLDIYYDPGVFEFRNIKHVFGNSNILDQATGHCVFTYGDSVGRTGKGEFLEIGLTVKANPKTTKDALIAVVPRGDKHELNDGNQTYIIGPSAFNTTVGELEVTGLNAGGNDPVFTVTAVDDGTKTTVTVANKGDKVGKVYVASYNGEVLTKCEAKDLADGSLEFAVTGSVKVFVWDANNVPLLDNYVVATAPVQ